MLFAQVPVTLISATIWPEVNPIPLLLVSKELSFVADAVWIYHNTLSLLIALFPLAKVFPAICPNVDTEATWLIVGPLALIS